MKKARTIKITDGESLEIGGAAADKIKLASPDE